jgi:hypothetical protein
MKQAKVFVFVENLALIEATFFMSFTVELLTC